MRLIRGIYRYPIKGLSPQPLRGVQLDPDQPFPFDRVFALARPGRPVDVARPKWAKKGSFLYVDGIRPWEEFDWIGGDKAAFRPYTGASGP